MELESVDYLKGFIDEHLIEKLKANKIDQLFPVQKVIIPLLVNQLKNLDLTKPHDLCISSPTGSGKTYTFCLPIIQHLLKFSTKELRALIILPVTDLALQVYKVFNELCTDLHINVASAIGNRSLDTDLDSIFYPLKDNVRKNRAEILISTPGKLIELITNVTEFSLKNVQILVVDEVDRILNSELEHDWIDNLEMSLYDNRNEMLDCTCSIKQMKKYKYTQFNGCCLSNYSSSRNIVKLLFSATLNNEKSKLDILNLFEPLYFNFSTVSTLKQSSNRFELPKTLNQRFINVQTDFKPAMIVYLMRILNYRKVICFVGSKDNAHRLFLLLSKYHDEFNVFELSSQINAEQRDKLKNDFSLGEIDLIICTDILARGIDIQDVNCVINYEPPHNVQAYVHRVGRTARAGKQGTSITLVDSTEKQRFSVIARKTVGNRNLANFKLNYDHKKFDEIKESYVKMLSSLKDDVIAERKKKKKQRFKTVHNLK